MRLVVRAVPGIAAVLIAGLLVPVASGLDSTPPKIKKADMIDQNGNGRVDRVVLTYSEKVNHTLDTDGVYPFAVVGYAIASVEAASGSKTLTITLAEKASVDLTAKPKVSYTQTNSQPVTDLAGNEAAPQSWSFTFPALGVYVSTAGNDGNPGSQTLPRRTINSGVTLAAALGARDVFVAVGSYAEGAGVNAAPKVGITGGFADTTWYRAPSSQHTAWTGSPQALLLDGDKSVAVKYATLEGIAAGASAYGIRALNASTLTLSNATVQADAGAAGGAGSTPPGTGPTGGPGTAGQPGAEDSGFGCSSSDRPLGGPGGVGVTGAAGGRGGDAGHDSNSGFSGSPSPGGAAGGQGTPSHLGNWNPTSTYLGSDGSPGAAGANGLGGAPAYGAGGYAPGPGGLGVSGQHGTGAGGGGGGGGGVNNCDSYGGGGGGGGAGGGAGGPGTGGGSAGGSFAVFLSASTATITKSTLVTLGGGTGGAGAAGQPGGVGGLGGWGGDTTRPDAGNPYGGSGEQDDGSNGGRGGHGGNGGAGGAGGGGAGGPSIGVVLFGGSTATLTGDTFQVGPCGTGGSSPGNSGPAGLQAQTLTV